MLAVETELRSWMICGLGGDATAHTLLLRAPIYLNNYRSQLLGCLEDSFPQTLAWIGSHSFRAAAARHIARCPPSSWTLDDYAQGFPGALAGAWPNDPEIGELARLEQALADALIAPDAAVLTVADLAETDWDQAALRLAPSCAMLDLLTNAAEIWSALTEGITAPASDLGDGHRVVLVWRRDWTCRFRQLEPDEAAVLIAIGNDGKRFSTICEHLVGQLGKREGIARAGALLVQWAQDGVLCPP
ncbi:HvfC/BufC family peptide modification chaperone [Novosphingobium lentum]|uniref:HvfC/BufC family peptide modification chaperone n=1 Tax=Novosphingobium lentum TaxID=145287 RepID=UPI0008315835|nr:putative DNA-binding domain-containing protein [Novosphingobium lentum]